METRHTYGIVIKSDMHFVTIWYLTSHSVHTNITPRIIKSYNDYYYDKCDAHSYDKDVWFKTLSKDQQKMYLHGIFEGVFES